MRRRDLVWLGVYICNEVLLVFTLYNVFLSHGGFSEDGYSVEFLFLFFLSLFFLSPHIKKVDVFSRPCN